MERTKVNVSRKTLDRLHKIAQMETKTKSATVILDYMASTNRIGSRIIKEIMQAILVDAKTDQITKDYVDGKITAEKHKELFDEIEDKEMRRMEKYFYTGEL